jgi:hypothetical protein
MDLEFDRVSIVSPEMISVYIYMLYIYVYSSYCHIEFIELFKLGMMFRVLPC